MSNEPGSGRRPALSELIASWRKVASIVVKHQRDGAADVEAIAYRTCANELEAALPASSEGAHGQCVCTVDDGLVQEWISKARAVARAKGFETTPAEGAHGLKCDKCGTAMTHTQSLILLWPNGPWLCPTCASVLVDDLEGDLAEGAHGWQDRDVTLLRMFVGFISGDVPELHQVEVPRLAESIDRFRRALLTPSTPEDQ
jgi:hypothetical protein